MMLLKCRFSSKNTCVQHNIKKAKNDSKIFLSRCLLILLMAFISASGTVTFIFLLTCLKALTSTSFHATSIPWLTNQYICQETGRIWRDDKCWDEEHNPTF